eukprot:392342_1
MLWLLLYINIRIGSTNHADLMRGNQNNVNTCLGENCVKNIEIDAIEWLKQNRLDKFINYFQENELIIDDLLTYEENDMNSVIEDCKISAHAYKKRFKNAIRKLQFEATKNNGLPFADNINKIHRIVISTKEYICMTQLEVKLKDIENILNQSVQAVDNLLNVTQTTGTEIEFAFESFRKKLNEREKFLKTVLKNKSDTQLNILKQQQSNLNAYKTSIENALAEQNALILDPILDSVERETEIIQITNNKLGGIDEEDMVIKNYTIKFHTDDNSRINDLTISVGEIIVTEPGDVEILMFSEQFKSVDGLVLSHGRKVV